MSYEEENNKELEGFEVMTLRLDSVMSYAVRTKGKGGPQIMVEMEYLPELSSNRRLTRNRYTKQTVVRGAVVKWMEQLTWMISALQRTNDITFSIPLRIGISGEFPTKVVPDTSNFVKCILDSVEDALGINDKFYSVDCSAARTVPGCDAKLVITIGEVGK